MIEQTMNARLRDETGGSNLQLQKGSKAGRYSVDEVSPKIRLRSRARSFSSRNTQLQVVPFGVSCSIGTFDSFSIQPTLIKCDQNRMT